MAPKSSSSSASTSYYPASPPGLAFDAVSEHVPVEGYHACVLRAPSLFLHGPSPLRPDFHSSHATWSYKRSQSITAHASQPIDPCDLARGDDENVIPFASLWDLALDEPYLVGSTAHARKLCDLRMAFIREHVPDLAREVDLMTALEVYNDPALLSDNNYFVSHRPDTHLSTSFQINKSSPTPELMPSSLQLSPSTSPSPPPSTPVHNLLQSIRNIPDDSMPGTKRSRKTTELTFDCPLGPSLEEGNLLERPSKRLRLGETDTPAILDDLDCPNSLSFPLHSFPATSCAASAILTSTPPSKPFSRKSLSIDDTALSIRAAKLVELVNQEGRFEPSPHGAPSSDEEIYARWYHTWMTHTRRVALSVSLRTFVCVKEGVKQGIMGVDEDPMQRMKTMMRMHRVHRQRESRRSSIHAARLEEALPFLAPEIEEEGRVGTPYVAEVKARHLPKSWWSRRV